MAAGSKRRGHNERRTPADEQRARAEDELCVDVQMLISEVMVDLGVTQRELAKRLGVSEARVAQFFVPGWNMTVRTVASVLHALGQRVVITADERDRRK